MHKFRFAIFVLISLVLLSSTSFSQQPATSSSARPRIGLALSGGGALGLAHIGVLKYFDEHHVPVDAVAGTSMGGLVGGFYATGHDAKQLQAIVQQADWSDLLRLTPKYEDRPVAEKQDWNRSDIGVTLRFKRNLSLPAGLNPGQPLALLLSRYTSAYADVATFDELPIPFRCVATDLRRGEAFTLDRGSLPLALRATMAIPGAFTPVKWNDRLLVDGGAVDNIPVDVARKMNSDVVIAISLEIAPASETSLSTLTGVLRQVVSVVVRQNELHSLEKADVVIPVQLQKYDSFDYVHADAMIAAGYTAAESMAEKLRPYELSDADWQDYIAARKARIKTEPGRGRIVAVEAAQPKIRNSAQHELENKLPGVVDRKKIENTLAGITAATSLPSAYYGWQSRNGEPGYKITLEQRPAGGEVLLRPSLALSVSGGEPFRTSLRISSVTVYKDAYKSRVLAEGSIGYDPGFRMEYYRPIDGASYFVAPGFFVQRTNVNAYAGAQLTAHVRDRFAGTLYAGLGTWRFLQWRLGTIAGYDRVSERLVVDGVEAKSTAFANLETRLLIDTQDSGALPSRGTHLSSALGYSVRNYSYPYFDTAVSKFVPLKNGAGIFVLGHGATSFGRKLPFYDQFTAGGIADLPAYRLQDFHANTMGIAGAGAYAWLPKLHTSNWRPVLAVWHEVGRFDLGSLGWETHQSSSIGIFGPSPLGPVGIALSATEDGKLKFRLVSGRF